MQTERRKLIRGFLGAVAMSLVPRQLVYAENLSPKIEANLSNTREFIDAAKNMGGTDAIGIRLNNAWVSDDGLTYMVYQKAILVKPSEGVIQTFRTLDEMHRGGLDPKLKDGEFGVVIPPVSPELQVDDPLEFRSRRLSIPIVRQMEDHIIHCTNKGLLVGRLTSLPQEEVDYIIYRFQNMAFKYWKNNRQIDALPIGEVAMNVGMVPDFAKTITPQLDLEPEFKNAREVERFSPSSRSPRLGDCQLTNVIWEGKASYYSAAGCMGCNKDQRMANSEIFNENAMTMAFMRTGLNRRALVINQETGDSVVVKVTDRGHFEDWGRIADLSKGVAQALGFDLGRGLFPVKIVLLDC